MTQGTAQSSRNWLAIGLIVIGAILVIGSIFADALGASWGGEGYGWKQLLATISGLMIGLAGVAIWLRSLSAPR